MHLRLVIEKTYSPTFVVIETYILQTERNQCFTVINNGFHLQISQNSKNVKTLFSNILASRSKSFTNKLLNLPYNKIAV